MNKQNQKYKNYIKNERKKILDLKYKDPQIFTTCSNVLLPAEANNTNNANKTRMAIHGEGSGAEEKAAAAVVISNSSSTSNTSHL
jgi:hypothetical protein